MHHVVTSGAGFIGTTLVRRLLMDSGSTVTVVDDLSTGKPGNLHSLADFVEADVAEHWWINEISDPDVIWHLASPCSPSDYQVRRVDTLLTNALGTGNALELARQFGAKFVLASTSEVYGDPLVHPQPEEYWGNVSSLGPRSCYDEGKRYAEALTVAAAWEYGLDVRIARIFNTYGPHMPDDGRVVIRFLTATLNGEPIEVHGTGEQTRSFCYVTDTVDALVRLAASGLQVCNIGSPREVTINALAEEVLTVIGTGGQIKHIDGDVDDPQRRCPDITQARSLGWSPDVRLRQGLQATAAWLRETR